MLCCSAPPSPRPWLFLEDVGSLGSLRLTENPPSALPCWGAPQAVSAAGVSLGSGPRWEQEGRTVVELEVVGRLGGPQPHGVDSVILVARHRGVVWHGQHHLPRESVVPDLGRAPRGWGGSLTQAACCWWLPPALLWLLSSHPKQGLRELKYQLHIFILRISRLETILIELGASSRNHAVPNVPFIFLFLKIPPSLPSFLLPLWLCHILVISSEHRHG